MPAAPAPKLTWVRFDGKASLAGERAVLNPNLDPRIRLTFRIADVRVTLGQPEVRVGAECLAVDIPPDSVLNQQTNLASPGRGRCEGNATMCVGGLELCCHNRRNVGSCDGYWRC
jgi:hypothetical protein